jgi:hypothetical protein
MHELLANSLKNLKVGLFSIFPTTVSLNGGLVLLQRAECTPQGHLKTHQLLDNFTLLTFQLPRCYLLQPK